jgi:zinc transport system substrate-binding protein
MKRIIYIAMLFLLTAMIVTGCGSSGNNGGTKAEAPKPGLKIVATIFPEYSWVKEIMGKEEAGAELTLLSKKGADMHSYQPAAEDILRIANCDLFLYVGGESDKWVDKALKEGGNPKRKVINLMKLLGNRVKIEGEAEGMQKHEHHEHDKDGHGHHDKDKHDARHEHDKHHGKENKHHHEGPEYDEHVWLSLKNADIICKAIAEELAALDVKNASTYRANYDAYSKKLAALDKQYKDTVDKAPVKVVLFGDRFPFRYLTDDYGLKYYAAFNGCSAETEASFETVVFLAKKMDELKLPAVFTIEGRQHKLARTIVDNSIAKNQKVLTLNSMQSVTEEEIKNGAAYLNVMEDNLKVLKQGLFK